MRKKGIKVLMLFLLAALLSACQPTAGVKEPTLTLHVLPTEAPTPAPTKIPTVPAPFIASAGQSGDPYQTLLTIPAGETGLPYRGVEIPNSEITGPNAITVLSDGSFVVADLIGNRLWRYDSSGQILKMISLDSLGILNVADLQAFNDELYVLEIYLGPPVQYRVDRLSAEGNLIAIYDIPAEYRIDNGLTGITLDCDGNVLLELNNGSNFYRLVDSKGTLKPIEGYSDYECGGRSYHVFNPDSVQKPGGENPSIAAGSITVETRLTTGLGGLQLARVLADGSFFVIREDVVNDNVIQVDETLHYISADGVQLGVARVPIAERYYYVMRDLTIGPDGQAYVLLPQSDSIHILRLNFYKSLGPLVPGAEIPLITKKIST